jgi:acetyl-CoA acyltransferase
MFGKKKELKECVVVDAVRIPIGRSGWKGMEKKGMYADISAQDLLATAVEAVVKRVQDKSSAFDPKEIDDMAVGCLSQVGEQAGNLGRIGVLAAGLPDEVAGWTIDRYCNAGLQAINSQAHAIMSGAGDIMLAAGVEHMSHYPMGTSMLVAQQAHLPVIMSKRLAKRPIFGVVMGAAAEMVAEKYKLTREEMDKLGLWSHQKATKAMRDEAWYKKRVVPLEIEMPEYETKMVDGKEVKERKGMVKKRFDKDETVRPQCLDDPAGSLAKIAKLEARFKKGGMVTAGNSSQIVDGAAACMLMSREKADKLGIKPMARIVSTAVAGHEPLIMLLGPIPAMKKAMARAGGLTMKDIDIFEANEAFASPVLAFCKEFDVAYDDPKINPTGGAIALGHPIGASGVIYFTEMVWELMHTGKRYGMQTLCGGGGVGIATIVERVS